MALTAGRCGEPMAGGACVQAHHRKQIGKRKEVREQRGNIFRRGKSWFLRYCDNVMQTDGTVVRMVVCKKLPVPFCDEFRTKASVKPFAQEILAPINAGMVNPQSTMLISDFVEKVYLPEYVQRQLRPSKRWRCRRSSIVRRPCKL